MKYVILHGTDSNHTSNWFPWLKERLESMGHTVWVPDLPESAHPNITKYNDFLLGSGWDFSDNVLIGHSSGSVAINGLLQALPKGVHIAGSVLVGTFRGDLGWDALHGVNVPFDFEKIKSRVAKTLVIHSDNDPYCPLDGAEWIANELGAEFILLPSMQHFSYQLDPRFDTFPKLLEIMKARNLA